MGNGRVIDDKPDSLRRISFFEHVISEKNKTKNEKNKTEEDVSSIQKLKDINHNPKDILTELKKILKDEKNLNTEFNEYEKYKFVNNADNQQKILVQNKDIQKERIHTDGIFLDYDTGQLIYFLALEGEVKYIDTSENASMDHITEGAEVEFENDYKGVCEVMLHEKQNKVRTDKYIPHDDEKAVVVRFVKITAVAKPKEEDEVLKKK